MIHSPFVSTNQRPFRIIVIVIHVFRERPWTYFSNGIWCCCVDKRHIAVWIWTIFTNVIYVKGINGSIEERNCSVLPSEWYLWDLGFGFDLMLWHWIDDLVRDHFSRVPVGRNMILTWVKKHATVIHLFQ